MQDSQLYTNWHVLNSKGGEVKFVNLPSYVGQSIACFYYISLIFIMKCFKYRYIQGGIRKISRKENV